MNCMNRCRNIVWAHLMKYGRKNLACKQLLLLQACSSKQVHVFQVPDHAGHQLHLQKQRSWSFHHMTGNTFAVICWVMWIAGCWVPPFSLHRIHSGPMSYHHRQCRNHHHSHGLSLGLLCTPGAMPRYQLQEKDQLERLPRLHALFCLYRPMSHSVPPLVYKAIPPYLSLGPWQRF